MRPARRRAESEERASPAWLFAAVALVALASTGAAYWNHGTVGPSRYGLWLLPFLFVLLAEALEGSGGHGRRLVLPLAVLAALSQGAITFARGGLHAPEDYTRHSIAARWVLDVQGDVEKARPYLAKALALGAVSGGDAVKWLLAPGRSDEAFARARRITEELPSMDSFLALARAHRHRVSGTNSIFRALRNNAPKKSYS